MAFVAMLAYVMLCRCRGEQMCPCHCLCPEPWKVQLVDVPSCFLQQDEVGAIHESEEKGYSGSSSIQLHAHAGNNMR